MVSPDCSSSLTSAYNYFQTDLQVFQHLSLTRMHEFYCIRKYQTKWHLQLQVILDHYHSSKFTLNRMGCWWFLVNVLSQLLSSSHRRPIRVTTSIAHHFNINYEHIPLPTVQILFNNQIISKLTKLLYNNTNTLNLCSVRLKCLNIFETILKQHIK